MQFEMVDKVCIFCARRNSGKSQLLKYLVGQYRDKWEKIYVISPTEKVNLFYKKAGLADDNTIFETYEEDWIQSLISKLTLLNANKPEEERKKCLIIMDDIAADAQLHLSKALKVLTARGRHISCSIVITIQSLTMIPPILRQNADFVFLGQLNNASLNIACDEYLAGNLDKKGFIEMYRKHTGDYKFLIVNQNSIKDTNNLNLIFGTIKTPPEFL